MNCNGNGDLESIKAPTTPEECSCECTTNDLTWQGETLECINTNPGDSLTSIIINIAEEICEIVTNQDVSDVTYCVPNDTAPTGNVISDHLQFISDNLIPRTGNSCDCPVTDDIFFADEQGIKQCDGSGEVIFTGDNAEFNTAEQLRVGADLRVAAGFGANSELISSSTSIDDPPSELSLSYFVDASAGNIQITLPDLTNANNQGRIVAIRRIDCNTSFTVTLDPVGLQTIEGNGNLTVPIGHSYVIQQKETTTDWRMIAQYFGCDTLEAQDTGDIYMAFKLGIGDSTPDAKLDVSNADTAIPVAIFEQTGASAVDLVRVRNNGSTVDVFDEEGNLHVGGSNPTARVHITGKGTTTSTFGILVEDSAGEDHFWVDDGGTTVIRTATDVRYQFTGNTINFTTDIGVIRDQNMIANLFNWGGRHATTGVTLTPASSTSGIYFSATPTATASSGTNDIVQVSLAPVINLTGTATGDTYGVKYSPTYTSTGGNNYGFVATGVNKSGFGVTSVPVSTLESGGSFGVAITTVSGDTTLTSAHGTVIVDTTGGDVDITLPAANTCARRIYTIKKKVAGNTMNVISPDNIDGSGSKAYGNIYSSISVQSDGATYWIIAELD